MDRRYLSGPPLPRLLRRLQVPRAPASTVALASTSASSAPPTSSFSVYRFSDGGGGRGRAAVEGWAATAVVVLEG
ncbi:hypothetical protein RHGRI_024961 [Rhododendron griersonianum]|uniref:Uncharacterized protein n=1 Tax=Rhododendron griersonianum TaxID=479676 RepID=A0AAV6JBE5_9ERIC|nr:hypothetical protein RHGRI_024957 [Rhododendron griersonianum]KAG5537682.1 hypothetical protein RHGRI_024961 [Rhododendron griersonianum]